VSEKPGEIPEVQGHPSPPDTAAWDAGRGVMTSGSDVLWCQTKLKDGVECLHL